MLSDLDLLFVKTIDTRFPEKGILASFNRYSSANAYERLAMATQDLKNIDRTGWVNIGAPKEFVQNVWQHEQSMMRMVKVLGGSKNAIMVVKYHDHTEALVTDFTPHDDITKFEKSSLEHNAAKIIFAEFPAEYYSWLEYGNKKTSDAILGANVDKLEMACYALYIEEHQPKMKNSLNEFWEYADKKITLPSLRNVFAELQTYRNDKTASASIYKEMKPNYDQLRLG